MKRGLDRTPDTERQEMSSWNWSYMRREVIKTVAETEEIQMRKIKEVSCLFLISGDKYYGHFQSTQSFASLTSPSIMLYIAGLETILS